MVASPIPARGPLAARKSRQLVRNIEGTFNRSNDQQIQHGMLWYPHAQELAHDIGTLARLRSGGGESHVSDVERGAGIISALSPQVSWKRNQVMARELANTGRTTGSTRAFIEKALRIREGENPEDVLHTREGHKTYNFFHNIADPEDPNYVTIDRHAHDLAVGRKFSDQEHRGLYAKGRYQHFSDAYQRAADRIGILPHQVQATTWLNWTGRNSYDD